jgi:hypothetical protein
MEETPLLKQKLQGGAQHAEPVLHASAKVDGRRFFKIFGWARNLSDAKSKVNTLRQDLIVEHEIIRIFQQRKFG